MAEQAAASVLQSFPCKAVLFTLFVVLLPLLPAQAPAGFAGQAFLAKAWELLHLLVVGIAVSYGLFSRKNADSRGAEKDAAPAKPDARYVSQMLQDSLVFDDDDLSYSPHGLAAEDGKVQSWSSLHHPNEPLVMVADDGNGDRSHRADAPPLSLPVRTLKSQLQHSNPDSNSEWPRRSFHGAPKPSTETVLPSPIPWGSRSGRFDASQTPRQSQSPSPKGLSPAPSLSKETLAKTVEDFVKRTSTTPYEPACPPPAPPPPPPFLGHGHHPVTERRTAAKSFKEELKDHSMRGKGHDSHLQGSHSSNSVVKPIRSLDGPSSSGAKSVRTLRPREVAQSQIQSQELIDDAALRCTAYQTVSKFQYEKGSDHSVDKVTGSSEDSESSSDDDDASEYSARTSPPSSTPTPEMDENEVDRKAEEFIAKFREQIRLQRIESIKMSAGPLGLRHSK